MILDKETNNKLQDLMSNYYNILCQHPDIDVLHEMYRDTRHILKYCNIEPVGEVEVVNYED